MDANEGLRETVDEDKHLRRGPDPRQSLVENPWIDNSKFAMVRWINTRDRLQCVWNWCLIMNVTDNKPGGRKKYCSVTAKCNLKGRVVMKVCNLKPAWRRIQKQLVSNLPAITKSSCA